MSKDALRIPPHQHCKVCGRAVPLKREYCTNECKEKDLKAGRRAKRWNRIFLIMLMALFVYMMLLAIGVRG